MASGAVFFFASLAFAGEIEVCLNASTPEKTAAKVAELEALRNSAGGEF